MGTGGKAGLREPVPRLEESDEEDNNVADLDVKAAWSSLPLVGRVIPELVVC
ncbi:hypothetical protein DACRYDRAFT_25052 [Dacryopinax primogenitus]|uniref:Uncharacterized protein n=1 Tax=Dacryopinax primogenitus (strain DJM 731) TaxID=1858805 RepID=M5FNM9_DACPD|nr:uncharacterized protein DACRYDRAFT_25052 [Dacryopinax primogenitus]EJT97705.1 hypothetical protein DACRYDRAFT_25052 [Dacryopinax primogenitus]